MDIPYQEDQEKQTVKILQFQVACAHSSFLQDTLSARSHILIGWKAFFLRF